MSKQLEQSLQGWLGIAAKTFFGSAIESDVDAIDRAVKTMLNHFDRRTKKLAIVFAT
ncbi:MAG: hypothetical protein ACRC62_21140 [Microcoleus sp.]